MKKSIKWIAAGLALLLIVIQFFRPQQNSSAVVSATDITQKYAVPAPVLALLQRSCYDCHSDNTHYPWYNHIQPVAWYLDHHVREGKRELNFSAFAGYSPKRAAHKLDEIISETGEHEMPMSSYLWIHPGAKLSDQEIDQIVQWAGALEDSIRAANHLPRQ